MTHWLDRAYASLGSRGRLYRDGWGDLRAFDELATALRSQGPIPAIDPELRRAPDRPGLSTWEGSFPSPTPGLPPESRAARFLMILPEGRPNAPVCVFTAASGEEGYAGRRRAYLRLVRRGLGVVFLEASCYGSRRPAGQLGAGVRTAAEGIRMTQASFEESLALLAWLRARGHARLGVTGYSLGGYAAAYAAVRCPFPIVAIPAAAGAEASTGPVRGLHGRLIDWESLGPGARARLSTYLEPMDLRQLPPPVDASRAVVIGCTGDGYVAPDDVERLHRHWPGSTLRWIRGGHVSSFLFRADVLRDTIAESFELPPAPALALPDLWSQPTVRGSRGGRSEGTDGTDPSIPR